MNDFQELLELTRDNNRMLKEIIEYINVTGKKADNENTEDFFRNIIANLISTAVIDKKAYNQTWNTH